MIHEKVKPNSVTLVSLLSACARLGIPQTGKSIHSYAIKNPINLDVALCTALVTMYAKCSHINKAFHVFTSMESKNLQAWTIMITAFADHGRGMDAIDLFTKMEASGLRPDSLAFSSILSVCSRLGLVEQGQRRLLLELEPELGANYVAVANASAISDCWDDVVRIRRFMLQKGLKKVPGCSWVEGNNGRKNKKKKKNKREIINARLISIPVGIINARLILILILVFPNHIEV
ncbi:Pentatricopeptide repeat-containing protein [Acorus calamus]|uniref:Pentatricopeptide repeat-containing protein n=1 Tax=Acorus calamus TaxID=4465 RepID=A0AAV9CHU7_ACOCL|nr:Pentatricopeptide repeat-containing protein [Acorus calamus]